MPQHHPDDEPARLDEWTQEGPAELVTDRLYLRAFRQEDAPRVRALAGHPDVARMVDRIPHPYPEGAAEAWIRDHGPAFARREGLVLAIVPKEFCSSPHGAVSGPICGAVELRFHDAGPRGAKTAEIGYWLGVPFWGRGFATEAALAMVDWGFRKAGLQFLLGRHLIINQASANVLRKVGLRPVNRGLDETGRKVQALRMTRAEWVEKMTSS